MENIHSTLHNKTIQSSSSTDAAAALLNICYSLGYFSDEQKIQSLITEIKFDHGWLFGVFSYPKFIAEEVEKRNPDNKPGMFITLFRATDRQAAYPGWRADKQKSEMEAKERHWKEEAELAKLQCIAEARTSEVTCPSCKRIFTPNSGLGSCSCGCASRFVEEMGEYEFRNQESSELLDAFEKLEKSIYSAA